MVSSRIALHIHIDTGSILQDLQQQLQRALQARQSRIQKLNLGLFKRQNKPPQAFLPLLNQHPHLPKDLRAPWDGSLGGVQRAWAYKGPHSLFGKDLTQVLED